MTGGHGKKEREDSQKTVRGSSTGLELGVLECLPQHHTLIKTFRQVQSIEQGQ